eukprot:scaffold19816_cov56-Cyclotella_meneghiniana.AAC.3
MNCISFLSIISLFLHASNAFHSPNQHFSTKPQHHFKHRTTLRLTPRQLQFWQDVSTGLQPIEKFYADENQSLDRIWEFCERAKSGVSAVGCMDGQEPSEEHVEGLTAKPFWDVESDPKNFPWATKLQDNAHIIINEFQHKLLSPSKDESSNNNNKDNTLFSGDSAWQSAIMGEGWSAFRLQRLGVWNVANCAVFPQTYELLRSLDIPLAVRGVCFARQCPNSGVSSHSDGRNFILTSHLGLQIPEGCWMKVGNEQRSWTEGKLTTIDTSFTHSTGNPSEEDRHVLIIDFWHPELTEAERAGLTYIYDLRNKFESGEIPFRQPKVEAQPQGEEEEKGLSGLWNVLTGGGGQ